jgi:hypothetical protein
MKRLVDEVVVYKVRDYSIKRVKTLNVSIKEHGYFKTLKDAKKSLLRDIESDIKFASKWVKEHQKDVSYEQKNLDKALARKNFVLKMDNI